MHDANWLLMCKKNKHEVLFHWKNEWRKTKTKRICQNEIIINGFSCLAHSTCYLNLKYIQKKLRRKKTFLIFIRFLFHVWIALSIFTFWKPIIEMKFHYLQMNMLLSFSLGVSAFYLFFFFLRKVFFVFMRYLFLTIEKNKTNCFPMSFIVYEFKHHMNCTYKIQCIQRSQLQKTVINMFT